LAFLWVKKQKRGRKNKMEGGMNEGGKMNDRRGRSGTEIAGYDVVNMDRCRWGREGRTKGGKCPKGRGGGDLCRR
jgi:hypothetical protein